MNIAVGGAQTECNITALPSSLRRDVQEVRGSAVRHVISCLLLGGARVYGESVNPHPSFSSHLSLALQTPWSPHTAPLSQCARLVRQAR